MQVVGVVVAGVFVGEEEQREEGGVAGRRASQERQGMGVVEQCCYW